MLLASSYMELVRLYIEQKSLGVLLVAHYAEELGTDNMLRNLEWGGGFLIDITTHVSGGTPRLSKYCLGGLLISLQYYKGGRGLYNVIYERPYLLCVQCTY